MDWKAVVRRGAKMKEDNSEVYKKWEGKIVREVTSCDDSRFPWMIGITFTDGAKYVVWTAQDTLHIEAGE